MSVLLPFHFPNYRPKMPVRTGANTTMPSAIEAYFLPELTSPEHLAGKMVVVIDVLRATTSIVWALAQGAECVVVCESIEEAKTIAASTPGAVLGGERQGLRIEGFDLGNSPEEFAAAAVRGKTVVFTTTNGTRAMRHARLAGRLMLGAFANLSAVCHAAAKASYESLVILCAGTNREVTREDVLLAGAITEELIREAKAVHDPAPSLNDQACIAADAWRQAARGLAGAAPLAETLLDSRGGRNLIEIGLARDIAIAAQIDRFSIVPEVDPASWRITALH
jgi:2-phosphosulfolactate phosphatase